MNKRMIPIRIVLLCLVFATSIMAFAQDKATPKETEKIATVSPVFEGNIAWYDVSQWPTEGQGYEKKSRRFSRLPARAEGRIPDDIWKLSQHSAGLATRFKTNANVIWVRWTLLDSNLAQPHMPATGVSGFDLYARRETDGKWLWAGATQPQAKTGTDDIVYDMDRVFRHYVMFFPLYNGVERVQIGIPKDCQFEPELPLSGKPIVYYGTSITHGGCASRPGNTYTAMLTRRLGLPVINLGFSGGGRMEPVMGDLISELDASVFVLDCMPNMGPAGIKERAIPFIEKLRAAHPQTPILLVEGREYSNTWLKPGSQRFYEQCFRCYKDVFDHFINKGDKNIYFLSRKNLLGEEEDFDGTVDFSHPNDLGMYRQANALENALRPILKLSCP